MKFKKILSGILAYATVCTAVPYVSYSVPENISITANAVDEDEYTEGTYESLTYKAYADYVEISGCNKSATSVVIPDGIDGLPVTSIEDWAFGDCSSLTSITIPDSVTSIGNYSVPDELGGYICSFCPNLKEINVSEGNKNYSSKNGVLFNKEMTKLIRYPEGKLETEYIIPESVKVIEEYTFMRCKNLTSVTIPDSVTSIEDNAFYNCSNLTSVTIPNSVTSIGFDAFYNCSNLTSITIENPECDIYDNSSTISNDGFDDIYNGTIYGYENSTAQAYAEKYKRNFVSLGEAPTTDSPEKLSGDCNLDGTVDIADVVALASYIGDPENNPLDPQAVINCDVQNTGDGITSGDILMIQQYISEIVKSLS